MTANTDLKLAARAAGDRYYHTGEPCKRGHYAKRYSSNGCCVECLTGKADKPLTSSQLAVSRPYRFNSVVPVQFTQQQIDALEPYLLRCMEAYAIACGVAQPPYDMRRVQWAEETGRPVSECPI